MFSVDHLLGMQMQSDRSMSVNFRQGKKNQITCNKVEVIAANCTGRRLTLQFSDANREVMQRRVYFEHFEKIAEKFGVDI